MKLLLISLLILITNVGFSQEYNPTQIKNIEDNSLANEGDMYLDTTNDIQYIGTTEGKLKILTPKFVRVIEQTGSYTLDWHDSGAVFTFNSATDINLTIPSGLPIGFNISVYQLGAGNVVFTPAAGVTLSNRLSIFVSAGPGAGVGLVSTGTDAYHLTGDLKK